MSPFERLPARHSRVGGIPVTRLLPVRQRRLIGAWCFLDHAGPSHFAAGEPGLRVGPHPHIGLQTFTWMIRGRVLHRDSLGHEQIIQPGQVNLMTAGRGIAHSEESVAGERELHAAQLWIALPYADRHTPPRFDHYPRLPMWSQRGVCFTLLAGEYAGHRAPTLLFSPLVGLDLHARQPTTLTLALRPEFEYGLLVLEGGMELDGEWTGPNELVYVRTAQDRLELSLEESARVLLLGGEPLEERIYIWWNLVGHSEAEIAEALADWQAGSPRFGKVKGYDGEAMAAPPLPAGQK
ncbi:pirin family protein [Oceanimonas pelagia]|uniref:Pirin family protein n=1 Tax=Oceanimonas pelagia TaxID=3028314 RepID=A0AA50KNL1_9GAMM|nr:pirin family protein [Oceanimonas pelagia]WMC10844.1 pirin family protein [Oceanimonas pelagia]